MRDHLVWFSIGALTAMVATVGAGILLAILGTSPRRPGLGYYRRLSLQAWETQPADDGGPSSPTRPTSPNAERSDAWTLNGILTVFLRGGLSEEANVVDAFMALGAMTAGAEEPDSFDANNLLAACKVITGTGLYDFFDFSGGARHRVLRGHALRVDRAGAIAPAQ